MTVQHNSEITPGSGCLILPNASRESMMFDEPWQILSVVYQTLP